MSIYVDDRLAILILERCAKNGNNNSTIPLNFDGYEQSTIQHCCKELSETGAVNYSHIKNLSNGNWYPISITVHGREILRKLSRTWCDAILENIVEESGKIFWGLIGTVIGAGITALANLIFDNLSPPCSISP